MRLIADLWRRPAVEESTQPFPIVRYFSSVLFSLRWGFDPRL